MATHPHHYELPDGFTAKIGLVICLGSGLWWPDPQSGVGRKGLVDRTYRGVHLHAHQIGGNEETFTRPDLGMHGGEIDDEHHELVIYSFIEVPTNGPYTITASLDGDDLPTSLHTLESPMSRVAQSQSHTVPILLQDGDGPKGRRSALLRITRPE